jgi:FkbM family methyltransferase
VSADQHDPPAALDMRKFDASGRLFEIAGDIGDNYYMTLPNHDLWGTTNYFKRLVQRQKIRCCIDVGANIGLTSIVMAYHSKDVKVIAFEPSPINHEYLRDNIERAGYSQRVELHKVALGNRTGEVNFREEPEFRAVSRISDSSDSSSILVPITTLDEFAASYKIEQIDLVKIDVEAFETDVVMGARNTIFGLRPRVIFEFNDFAIRKYRNANPVEWLATMMNHLGTLGYVNWQTGEATALPDTPQEAYARLKSMMECEKTIFDLVNQSA